MCVCVQQLTLRKSYDPTQWKDHFDSLDDANAWKKGCVQVTIVAAHTAMVEVTREAVGFVKGLCEASMNNKADVKISDIDISISESIDTKNEPSKSNYSLSSS